ncbi:MAG: hypothetical protein GVY24_05795 [Planctomycetes bacterium]|jgi:hypothetical protein|nr:hypothetical protein [Planctomycetota bacterium]
MSDESQEHNPLQGYFDWQVNTLMLAYDLADPLPGGEEDAHRQRRTRVEEEVRQFSLDAIPQQYKDDPNLDWPPEVMMALTRATFARVRQITEPLDLPG